MTARSRKQQFAAWAFVLIAASASGEPSENMSPVVPMPEIRLSDPDFPWLDGDGPTYGRGVCELHQLYPMSHGNSPVWTAYAPCMPEQIGTVRCWGEGRSGGWGLMRFCFRYAKRAPESDPGWRSTPCTYRGVTKECSAFWEGAPAWPDPRKK